jgi:hypothetical protein
MKKQWMLLGLLAVLLLVLMVRERFTSYEEALKDVGQTAGYITPSCPSGYTKNADSSSCERTVDGKKETATPSCPSGSSYVLRGSRGVCEPTTSGESQPSPSAPSQTDGQTTSVPAPTGTSTSAVSTPLSSVTGTSTGGTSGVLMGPTSGGGGRGKTVWGPPFVGTGESKAQGTTDSTKTTQYPELLGGLMGKTSTRIDQVGIVPPSGAGLDGVLPSSASLGTDANSRFLPYSRQPGDMDVVPDPYRLAKTYSTSSYSPKPEPVPFLADFSAFYK